MYKDFHFRQSPSELINDVQYLLNEYNEDKITHTIFVKELQNIVEYELEADSEEEKRGTNNE